MKKEKKIKEKKVREKKKKVDILGRFRRLGKGKKLILLVVVLGLGLGAWFIWGRNTDEEMPFDDMDFEQPQIPVERGDVKRTIYVTGNAQAKQIQEVHGVPGRQVLKVYVQAGDQVNEGDLIYELDDTQARLEYQLKQLEYEEMLNERANDTYAQTIKSEGRGEISSLEIKKGDEVTPETVVATIQNRGILELRNALSSTDAAAFSIGEKVDVFLPDYLIFVTAIITQIDQVDTHLKNEDGKYLSGAPVRFVTMELENPDSMVPGVDGKIQTTKKGRTIGVREAGQLAYKSGNDILAKTTGVVTDVKVREGDMIENGSVIASLDATFAKMGSVGARLSLQQAKLNLETAKEALDERIVRAEFSGKVTKLEVTEGKEIDTDAIVCVVAEVGQLIMQVVIDEYDIGQVYIGQKADVYLNAFGNEVFPGVIGEVSQQGVEQNGRVNFTAKIYIDGSGKIKPGMSGDADVFVELKENVLRLPTEALTILEDGLGIVQVMDEENMMQAVEVKIGIEGDRFVEILSGIKEGDMVVSQSGGGMNGMDGGGDMMF